MVMEATCERLQGRRFPLGRLVWTRGINNLVADDLRFSAFVLRCLRRHAHNDWGDLSDGDKAENNFAIDKHLRIFSAYKCPKVPDGKVWIITEADRSATTVLFPSEY